MKKIFLLLSLVSVCFAAVDTYAECIEGDCKNGKGIMNFSDGSKYEGQFKDGKMYGQGTLILPSGEKYIGGFKDDKRDGQGSNTWPRGSKYEGQWKDDNLNGKGTYIWPDGTRYEGQFKDGKGDGQGTQTFSDGREYVGQFKNGEHNGQGTLTFSDDTKYIGGFLNNKFHGQGTYIWPDGKKYVGQFKNDQRNGQGIFTSPDGTKYEGQWKNDRPDGQGSLSLPDGTRQVGEFKDGRFERKVEIGEPFISPNAPKDKPVILETALFEAMAPYIEKARLSYPKAKERFLKGLPQGHSFFVVTRLKDPAGRMEQVFIGVSDIQDGNIHGKICTKIIALTGYKYGDPYKFPEKELIDWVITRPDGSEEGNLVGKFLDEWQKHGDSKRGE